ncbi:MAG: hypothetical protein JXB88_12735 [Spirochaetales bacterium]|nr:hypothetical protein [Spirochaetales bacterium]
MEHNDDTQFNAFLDILFSEALAAGESGTDETIDSFIQESVSPGKPAGLKDIPENLKQRILKTYHSLSSPASLSGEWQSLTYFRLAGDSVYEKYDISAGFHFELNKLNLKGIAYLDENKVRIYFTVMNKSVLKEYAGKHIVVLVAAGAGEKVASEIISETGEAVITLNDLTEDTFNPNNIKVTIIAQPPSKKKGNSDE